MSRRADDQRVAAEPGGDRSQLPGRTAPPDANTHPQLAHVGALAAAPTRPAPHTIPSHSRRPVHSRLCARAGDRVQRLLDDGSLGVPRASTMTGNPPGPSRRTPRATRPARPATSQSRVVCTLAGVARHGRPRDRTAVRLPGRRSRWTGSHIPVWPAVHHNREPPQPGRRTPARPASHTRRPPFTHARTTNRPFAYQRTMITPFSR